MSEGLKSKVALVTGGTAGIGATKGKINALTKCAAVDWGRDGIRVHAPVALADPHQ